MQLHDGTGSITRSKALQRRARGGELIAAHEGLRPHERYRPAQARIQVVQSGEEVQDAFVDAQARECEPALVVEFEEPPVSQRPYRRHRAPMRIREARQRKPEGGICRAGGIVGLGARGRESAIHLHTRAHQQHVALERAQFECLRDPRRSPPATAVRHAPRQARARCGAVSSVSRARMRAKFRRQHALVCVQPRRDAHVISILRLRNAGGEAAVSMMGLSMPSTRSRAR